MYSQITGALECPTAKESCFCYILLNLILIFREVWWIREVDVKRWCICSCVLVSVTVFTCTNKQHSSNDNHLYASRYILIISLYVTILNIVINADRKTGNKRRSLASASHPKAECTSLIKASHSGTGAYSGQYKHYLYRNKRKITSRSKCTYTHTHTLPFLLSGRKSWHDHTHVWGLSVERGDYLVSDNQHNKLKV